MEQLELVVAVVEAGLGPPRPLAPGGLGEGGSQMVLFPVMVGEEG